VIALNLGRSGSIASEPAALTVFEIMLSTSSTDKARRSTALLDMRAMKGEHRRVGVVPESQIGIEPILRDGTSWPSQDEV